MPKQQIRTDSGASPVGAYSQGLRAGDFIFVSGQGPLDPALSGHEGFQQDLRRRVREEGPVRGQRLDGRNQLLRGA